MFFNNNNKKVRVYHDNTLFVGNIKKIKNGTLYLTNVRAIVQTPCPSSHYFKFVVISGSWQIYPSVEGD